MSSMTPEISVQPTEKFNQALERMKPDFKAALPSQIPVERFIRTTITAVQMNRELLQADKNSLLSSAMKAAQDGLLCDGREAALVIFNTNAGTKANPQWVKKVQYMPMLTGILKKIRNSGLLKTIAAHVVYERDFFEYVLGDEESITHKPHLGEDRGKPIAVYGVAKTKDDGIYREVMSCAQVEQVRSVSKSKDGGPWVQWWDEMAKKTVLRRLAKRLPSSADLEAVFENDNATYEFAPRHAMVAELNTKYLPSEVIETQPASLSEPELAEASPQPEEAAAPQSEQEVIPAELSDLKVMPEKTAGDLRIKTAMAILRISKGADKMQILEALGEDFTGKLSKAGLGTLRRQLEEV